jgi:hypothetical protein
MKHLEWSSRRLTMAAFTSFKTDVAAPMQTEEPFGAGGMKQ